MCALPLYPSDHANTRVGNGPAAGAGRNHRWTIRQLGRPPPSRSIPPQPFHASPSGQQLLHFPRKLRCSNYSGPTTLAFSSTTSRESTSSISQSCTATPTSKRRTTWTMPSSGIIQICRCRPSRLWFRSRRSDFSYELRKQRYAIPRSSSSSHTNNT